MAHLRPGIHWFAEDIHPVTMRGIKLFHALLYNNVKRRKTALECESCDMNKLNFSL